MLHYAFSLANMRVLVFGHALGGHLGDGRADC